MYLFYLLTLKFIDIFQTSIVFLLLKDNTIDRAMASSLVEFLVKNGHHDNRSVLKNNLEVLKTLVEVWCSVIDVPTK